MTIFLTSDQHFDHARIIEYSSRPFADVEAMNAELLKRHNSVVSPTDTVYHLGDFSLSEKVVPVILPQLHGTHHLIPGNHDRCFSTRPKHKKALAKYLSYGFASIQEQLTLQIGTYSVLLSHLPYPNLTDPDQRFLSHRPVNKGQILLHGHVHTHWKTKDRMLNVGVDVHDYRPISETEVLQLIQAL